MKPFITLSEIIDQPLHTGVAKGMRARTRDGNSRFAQIMTGPAGDRRIGERKIRCNTAEKEVAVSRLGSSVLEVVDYGVTHNSGKRIGRSVIAPLQFLVVSRPHPVTGIGYRCVGS